MAWGAVAGAAIGAIGPSLMGGGGSDGQGGQQQTVSKDPWSSAAPWLQENIKSGQALQNRYAVTPFNAQQVQGYNNQYGNADYMRSLTSGVLGQLNSFQPFDRNNQNSRPQLFKPQLFKPADAANPAATPQTFQFPDTQQATPGIQQIASATPYMQAPTPAPVMQQAAAPAPAPAGVDADALQKLRQELYSSRALADPSLDHPGWGGNWGY